MEAERLDVEAAGGAKQRIGGDHPVPFAPRSAARGRP
jgi:hypothetical protein